MTIENLQNEVDTWIRETGHGYHSVLTNMVLLTEEVGELARAIARTDGDQIPKNSDNLNYAEEIADILWVLVCIANQKDVNITEELHKNFVKKSKRDQNRFK